MSKKSRQELKVVERPEEPLDHAAVEAMAYQMWLERGCPTGSDQEDWFRAEAELRTKGKAAGQAA